MKQKFLISAMCAITLLSGCTDAMEETVSSLEKSEMQIPQTRATNGDSISVEEPEEFIISDEMNNKEFFNFE